MYTISEINGVKIYNLSAGKTLPQFLEESYKKHSSLRYNEDFRRRIELIQDFDFPTASTGLKMSSNQEYIVATGVYPPQVRLYETSEVSMKCLRGLDSEVVDFEILGEGYEKLVFACKDRNLEFHAQYGKHYKTRIPKPPRALCYNPFLCDLMIAGSDGEIYRMSLDEGKFLNTLNSESNDLRSLWFNKELNVLMSGGGDGVLEMWDYREKNKIAKMNGTGVSKLAGDLSNPLLYAVGSLNGVVDIFDMRYPKAVISIKHQYREAINGIKYHEKSRNLITSTKKIVKINNIDNGKLFTNIEPSDEINGLELSPSSGLLFLASESTRIGTYFIPALDCAPQWCHYIENLTEELEEEMISKVYDEYKYVSLEELEVLEAGGLIGTKMVKPYLGGFLMRYKVYEKLVEEKDPFRFERYRKERREKKMEERMASRISGGGRGRKGGEGGERKEGRKEGGGVNQEFKEMMKKKSEKKAKEKVDLEEEMGEEGRFEAMFRDPRYKIDVESEEFRRNNPSGKRGEGRVSEEGEERMELIRKKIKKKKK